MESPGWHRFRAPSAPTAGAGAVGAKLDARLQHSHERLRGSAADFAAIERDQEAPRLRSARPSRSARTGAGTRRSSGASAASRSRSAGRTRRIAAAIPGRAIRRVEWPHSARITGQASIITEPHSSPCPILLFGTAQLPLGTTAGFSLATRHLPLREMVNGPLTGAGLQSKRSGCRTPDADASTARSDRASGFQRPRVGRCRGSVRRMGAGTGTWRCRSAARARA